MFQGFPCDCVHDGHGPVVDERSRELSLGCLLGAYVNFLSKLLGLICELVLLATGSWVHWRGAAGVVRLDYVRWSMGSSVLMSMMSGGNMMSTLGAEGGGVCMTCTHGDCEGEGGS